MMMTKSWNRNQDEFPEHLRSIPQPTPHYCCYNFYMLVHHIRLFQVNRYGRITPIYTQECEDYEVYDTEKELGLEQWKYCPYCRNQIIRNEEYERWKKEEDVKQHKRLEYRRQQEFRIQHNGHDSHVIFTIDEINKTTYMFSRAGYPVALVKQAKCRYCNEIIDLDTQ